MKSLFSMLASAGMTVLSVGASAQSYLNTAASPQAKSTIPSSPTQADPNDLPGLFRSANGPYQIAAFKAKLDRQEARAQMAADERVAAVSMGRREFANKARVDAITGPDYSAVTPTQAAAEESRSKAKAAYLAWVTGKTSSQVAAAKKLYAAWLTMFDAMVSQDDPGDVWDTPAGTAYTQAAHEFEIDAMTP